MRARNSWRAWTDLELIELRELRGDGMSAPAIAAILGRTRASVKCRLQQDKLRSTRSKMVNAYLPLLRKPHSNAEVARILGVKERTVRSIAQRLRRRGYKIPRGTPPEGKWRGPGKKQLAALAAAAASV